MDPAQTSFKNINHIAKFNAKRPINVFKNPISFYKDVSLHRHVQFQTKHIHQVKDIFNQIHSSLSEHIYFKTLNLLPGNNDKKQPIYFIKKLNPESTIKDPESIEYANWDNNVESNPLNYICRVLEEIQTQSRYIDTLNTDTTTIVQFFEQEKEEKQQEPLLAALESLTSVIGNLKVERCFQEYLNPTIDLSNTSSSRYEIFDKAIDQLANHCIHNKNVGIPYAADIIEDSGKFTGLLHWISKINFSLADENQSTDAKGQRVNQSVFNFGTKYAFSELCSNDGNLPSLHLLWYGAPIIWLLIKPVSNEALNSALKQYLDSVNQNHCNHPLEHRNIFMTREFLDENNIQYDVVIQKTGDLVSIKKGVVYQQIHTGLNISEYIIIKHDRRYIKPKKQQFECAITDCSRTYKTLMELREHVKRSHRASTLEIVPPCVLCDASFKSFTAFRAHYFHDHTEINAIFMAYIHFKTIHRPFTHSQNEFIRNKYDEFLKAGLKNVTVFKCVECRKLHSSKAHFVKHLRKVHPKQKCPVCELYLQRPLTHIWQKHANLTLEEMADFCFNPTYELPNLSTGNERDASEEEETPTNRIARVELTRLENQTDLLDTAGKSHDNWKASDDMSQEDGTNSEDLNKDEDTSQDQDADSVMGDSFWDDIDIKSEPEDNPIDYENEDSNLYSSGDNADAGPENISLRTEAENSEADSDTDNEAFHLHLSDSDCSNPDHGKPKGLERESVSLANRSNAGSDKNPVPSTNRDQPSKSLASSIETFNSYEMERMSAFHGKRQNLRQKRQRSYHEMIQSDAMTSEDDDSDQQRLKKSKRKKNCARGSLKTQHRNISAAQLNPEMNRPLRRRTLSDSALPAYHAKYEPEDESKHQFVDTNISQLPGIEHKILRWAYNFFNVRQAEKKKHEATSKIRDTTPAISNKWGKCISCGLKYFDMRQHFAVCKAKKCRFCKKNYKNKYTLLRHINTVHLNGGCKTVYEHFLECSKVEPANAPPVKGQFQNFRRFSKNSGYCSKCCNHYQNLRLHLKKCATGTKCTMCNSNKIYNAESLESHIACFHSNHDRSLRDY